MNRKVHTLFGAACLMLAAATVSAQTWSDRFVWVFGWSLSKDSDVSEITKLLETSAASGLNGAIFSLGFDSLSKHDDAYFRRLGEIESACKRLNLEMIPTIFSVGYGGGILDHNRNLAEGLPVVDAPFVVTDGRATFEPDPAIKIVNGDFEQTRNTHSFPGFGFHDQPGEISFADTQVLHGGKCSLRMENFTANQYGHGRIMQTVKVKPHRSYRVCVWVKTEGLTPANTFNILVLVGDRQLAPRSYNLASTGDWRKLVMIFNSLDYESVNIYAGIWDGKSGKFWLDDWTIEEIGPINVIRRPGTPIAVRSEDGATIYEEGRDFEKLIDPEYNPYRVPDGPALALKLTPDSRIKPGQRLKVSWYHSMLIHDSQVTICMAEPEIYEIIDHEAKLLAEHLHPKKILLSMDEVRMGGTCKACYGRNMGELLGECITRQVQSLHKYSPGAKIYIWSDMLDPHHNAVKDYYLVRGDFTGSWNHVPKDMTIAVWGSEPREKNLKFFVDQGFETLCACYYDAPNLDEVKGWIKMAEPLPKVRGFMYTPWTGKYDLVPEFGKLLGGSTPSGKDSSAAAASNRLPGLRKLMDTPLRDTSICRGPDGIWYMTGTVQPFWAYNEGIQVWKSKDLTEWQPLGFVWKYGSSPWHKKYLDAKKPLWAPEIHYLKGTFWLTYSIPGWDGTAKTSGCGLLKSTSGKAEGPYQDMQPDERLGDEIDASLFQDDDGTVYFLWHSGKIARMKPDMSGLAEPYRWLKMTGTDPNPAHHSGLCAGIFGKDSFDHVGYEGMFLFKANNRYYLACADQYEGRYSCMISISDKLFGPYSPRYEAIPHGGHNMFFRDDNGQWWSSYFGSDDKAPWQERPGILPIHFTADGRIFPGLADVSETNLAP